MLHADCCHGPLFLSPEDRISFGHWLSGFTDGEGSFQLNMRKADGNIISYSGCFQLAQRLDRAAVLCEIQSFLGCGGIYNHGKDGRTASKPARNFMVYAVQDLVDYIIPHFEQFPLRTLKKNDFTIWAEAVRLINQIRKRKRVAMGRMGGSLPRWTAADLEKVAELKQKMEEGRSFQNFNENMAC